MYHNVLNPCIMHTVYLAFGTNLGDKEEKTRNPVLAAVGKQSHAAYVLLREQNTDCIFEWNEGNHFKDAALRTAKAFLWVMKRQQCAGE